MSKRKPRTTRFKLLTLCIVFVQILALTTTGLLTALGVPSGPTPQQAQTTALALHLPGAPWARLAEGLAWLSGQSETVFGVPQTVVVMGAD